MQELEQVAGGGRARQARGHLVAQSPHLGLGVPGMGGKAQFPARLTLGLTAPRRPILGMVLAGQVESAGSEVTAFGEGDQVFGLDRHCFGAYAEYVC